MQKDKRNVRGEIKSVRGVCFLGSGTPMLGLISCAVAFPCISIACKQYLWKYELKMRRNRRSIIKQNHNH